MNQNTRHWLKGNLPTWIATGLLGFVSFFVVREFNRNDRMDQDTRMQSIRIAVVEEQVREFKYGQNAMLEEIRLIRQHVMKQTR